MRVSFFVATFVVAIVVVVATKGSFGRLSSVHFQRLWLLFFGLGIQIVLEFLRKERSAATPREPPEIVIRIGVRLLVECD